MRDPYSAWSSNRNVIAGTQGSICISFELQMASPHAFFFEIKSEVKLKLMNLLLFSRFYRRRRIRNASGNTNCRALEDSLCICHAAALYHSL